jgi:hypothetical protein
MKINPTRIRKKLLRNMNKVPPKVRLDAQRKFNRAKAEMINEFESHAVTREIEAGPAGKNSSGTLGGYGNLFSFIGFYQGATPIETLRSLLNSYKIDITKPHIIKRNIGVDFRFRIEGPSIEQIEAATYLNWLGKSWVRGVERGMSGIGNYLASMGATSSRSGGGIQATQKMRGGAYRPTKYVSSLMRTFFLRLGR